MLSRPERWPRLWQACPHAATLRIFLDLYTLAYGLWLVVPLNTFGGGTIYRSMAFWPEWAWGLLMALPAATSLLLKWRGKASSDLLLGSAAWWGLWLLLSVAANPATGGVPLFGGLVLAYLWCWYCLVMDGRVWTLPWTR